MGPAGTRLLRSAPLLGLDGALRGGGLYVRPAASFVMPQRWSIAGRAENNHAVLALARTQPSTFS